MTKPGSDTSKVYRRESDRRANHTPAPSEAGSQEIERLQRHVASLEQTNAELLETLEALNGFRMKLATLTEKLNMITRLTQEINTLDAERIAEVAVRKIPLLVDAKYVSLFLWEPGAGELVLKVHNHPTEINRRVTITHHENTVMGLTLKSKRCQLIKDLDDFEHETGVKLERTFAEKYMTRSCMSVPLLAGATVMGILNLADKTDGGLFAELDDLPPLEQIGPFLGMALQNCALFGNVERLARTDGLTGLVNHRSFFEGLAREIHRCRRYGHRLSLIMCDVDNFKTVNDTLGHPQGDRVMQLLGKVVSGYVRQEDLAARYGGDEFAIILPETPLVGAAVVAERLRDKVLSCDFRREGISVPVRMSFGVAELQAGMGPADLVAAADRALYAAKSAGKDRIARAPGA